MDDKLPSDHVDGVYPTTHQRHQAERYRNEDGHPHQFHTMGKVIQRHPFRYVVDILTCLMVHPFVKRMAIDVNSF